MKVRIEDFQSLKRAEIEVKGFTALTGSNNSGKSALIRAIVGVFQNTPGDAFIRHGSKEAKVTLEFDDGGRVVWTRGKKASYSINGGDPLSPGRGAPEEVYVFGVKPVEIGGKSFWPNISRQFRDQLFLVEESGAVLAEAIANPEVIAKLNAVLKATDAEKREANTTQKAKLAEREKVRDVLKGFEGFDLAKQEVVRSESLRQVMQDSASEQSKLSEALDAHTRLSTRVSEFLGVQDVPLPSKGPSLSEVLSLTELEAKHRLFTDRALQFAGVTEVTVPSPALESRLSKLEWGYTTLRKLSVLSTKVESLSAIPPTEVGDLPSKMLLKVEYIQDLIRRRQTLLTTLGEVPTFPEFHLPNLNGVSELERISKSVSALEGRRASYEGQLGKCLEELNLTMLGISQIPKCPACGQVCEVEHA